MPKAVRISTSIAPSAASSKTPDSSQLVTVALFSGAGLLVSLVAIMMGVSGVGY